MLLLLLVSHIRSRRGRRGSRFALWWMLTRRCFGCSYGVIDVFGDRAIAATTKQVKSVHVSARENVLESERLNASMRVVCGTAAARQL